MEVDTSKDFDAIVLEVALGLAALADPARLAIVGLLGEGEQCVCDLQERIPMATNLLSYHLRVLRDARLVVATRRGRWMDYRLDVSRFAELWNAAVAAGVPFPGVNALTEGVGRS